VIRNLVTGKEQREPGGMRPPPAQATDEGPAAPARAATIEFSADSKTVVFSIFPSKAENDKAKKDKKVLVAITDGNDTTSINISLEDLMRKAQQSDALIYSISIVSEEEPRAVKKARRALHDLAAASGAMDYYHKDLEDVDRIVPEVANEIRHQYTRAYSPLNPALDGIFRKITVTVNAPGRPDARSRNGYYANAFVKK